jgi:hypothetical protein
MGVATQTAMTRVRPRDVLLVGAFVVGWSVGRVINETASAPMAAAPVPAPAGPSAELPGFVPQPAALARARSRRKSMLRRPLRLALAGVAASLVVAGAGLASRPDTASAPLLSPEVASQQRALAAKQAETARLKLLRQLELAGIAARRVGLPESPRPKVAPVAQPVVQPSQRAIALDTYVQAVGADTILRGLDASKQELEQKVLSDPRVDIYPAGHGDVLSGKLDPRVLAIIEYLAQANGSVSVSCLITGHSLYVAGRPGVVSAHIYGRAVDISAVGGTPILGHQGPGSVTEKAVEQLLALPESVEPLQVISLMTLGGPSFALPDHYNHIHIGY